MRVLVLGAYGLIGREIVRELLCREVEVVGLGRSAARGKRLFPRAEWIGDDLNRLTDPDDWAACIDGVDAVVNASGALQSGARDNLVAAQQDAIRALITACERAGVATFVQISAPGADPDAGTEFLRTKGEADRALRASRLAWVILKPGLVISSTAYGGTSLLRTLAAVPFVQPLVLAKARLQTVDAADVTRAVVRCLGDPSLTRREFDLVEPSAETLRSIVLAFRQWLGFTAPAREVTLPDGFGLALAKVADLAGNLGWRSPLRTTAIKVLGNDVVGDPEPWRRATGETFKPLAENLAGLPSTRQERFFARAQLAFPLAVVTFALFWIVSGLIGFWRHDAAASVISGALGEPLASLSVYAGSALDVVVGLGLLVQRTFRAGCLAAAAVSLGYLAAASIVVPGLWADPLGPLVKVLPVVALALVLAAMAEER